MVNQLPNLHHLELFYYIVRAGGISAAVRSMPYGIQQPALSGQIARLEEELGLKLFQRRPFHLTKGGKQLYDFISPFFSGLGDVTDRITGVAERYLRLAAPTTVIRDYLPEVLEGLRRARPDLVLSLLEMDRPRAIAALEAEEVDMVVTDLDGNLPAGMRGEVFLSLPLVLLLPEEMEIPAGGLRELAESSPLIRPAADTSIARLFTKGLVKKRLKWPVHIEVSSIAAYVQGGFGVGVSVIHPGLGMAQGVKAVPLKDFPELQMVGLWRGKPGVLITELLEGLRKMARRMVAGD